MKDKNKVRQAFRLRIKRRIRKKISGTPDIPRLVVYRANNNMSTQLVDDISHTILATINSAAKSYDKIKAKSNGKIDLSKQIGLDIAAKAKDLKVTKVVFDRNGYQYHGRVKAVADGAREGGLKF